MAVNEIGIDLGTSSVLVYVRGKGVVLKEPSVVAFDRDANRIKAIGEEARLLLGRTPGNIVAVHPMEHGVISDYMVTEQMLRFYHADGTFASEPGKFQVWIGDCSDAQMSAEFELK